MADGAPLFPGWQGALGVPLSDFMHFLKICLFFYVYAYHMYA